jgi:tetratricopeptide (TPR) repeat protein
MLGRVKPGLPAYSRVSYARELLGDHAGAVAAMRLAADTAVPGSEAAAWTAVYLGKLFFLGGDHRSAERQYRIALGHVPGYAAAFDGLALLEAARKRLPRAIALERRAVKATGLPEYVATLGDLLRRAGRPEAAARQYAIFNSIERGERANGVRNGLEEALVHIDHGESVRAATALAYADYRTRPTIHAADTVAWGLARQGRCAEAKGYSKRALRLGTEDASLFFHRGMIERCLGNRDEATRWFRRAVDLNPGFSVLWSPTAARFARIPG